MSSDEKKESTELKKLRIILGICVACGAIICSILEYNGTFSDLLYSESFDWCRTQADVDLQEKVINQHIMGEEERVYHPFASFIGILIRYTVLSFIVYKIALVIGKKLRKYFHRKQ